MPLALVALVAAPLGAQQMGTMHGAGQAGMMEQGMMPMCSMMGGQSMAGQGMMSGNGMAGHQGMMSGGGMAGMNHGSMNHGDMMGPGAVFGGVDLALTPDQDTKLGDLMAKAREEHQAHMQAAMSVQMGATASLAGAKPDLDAYQAAMREAADHMVQAHMAVARASVDARGLLTPDQLAKLPEGAQLMNTMMCGMMGGSMMGSQAPGGAHEQHHR